MSDVVRLRTFPETEVRAWLKALYSPDSYDDGALGYDGVTLENGADGTSEIVISAAKRYGATGTASTSRTARLNWRAGTQASRVSPTVCVSSRV